MTAFPLCNSLNWQLFAEDAGSESGVTEANAQPQAEVSPNGPEDFEKLIKGPSKQAYDARVKSILQQRLKNSRETAEKYAAAQPVLELMRQRLGIEGEDYGAMEQALRERLPEAPPAGQQRQVQMCWAWEKWALGIPPLLQPCWLRSQVLPQKPSQDVAAVLRTPGMKKSLPLSERRCKSTSRIRRIP